MDRAPVLVYKGTSIGQSKSMERFLAKKLGFAGANEIEEAQIDQISEHVRDIRTKYADARVGKTGDELEAAKATFIAEALPVWMEKLEKTLPGTNFAVGDKMSLADVYIQQL